MNRIGLVNISFLKHNFKVPKLQKKTTKSQFKGKLFRNNKIKHKKIKNPQVLTSNSLIIYTI